MKNIFVKLTFVIAVFLAAGCAGDCLKVGGYYDEDEKKIGGDLQYCFDKPASEKAGEPVLTSPTGTKSILLSAPDAAKIVAMLEKPSAAAKETGNIFVQLRKKLLQESK